MRVRVYMLSLLALLVAVPGAAQRTAQGAPVGGRDLATAEQAKVKPGDQVSLRIWAEPNLSGTFTVSASGDLVLPKVGVVKASNQSVASLQDSLQRAYNVYLRNSPIEVTVLRRIGVHGEVTKPGLYMVDLTMTLRDVIAEAGGVAPAGDPDRITVVRGGERIKFSRGQSAEMLQAK